MSLSDEDILDEVQIDATKEPKEGVRAFDEKRRRDFEQCES